MLPVKVELNASQKRDMEIARIALMNAAPFFAYYFYAEMVEYPTLETKTAATDGRRIFWNPSYFDTLKGPERTFVLAHEVYHTVMQHPTRMKFYNSQKTLRGLPYDDDVLNQAQDYVINADLIKNAIGICNSSWLYDPKITGEMLAEDVYVDLMKNPPPPQGGSSGQGHGNPTYGDGHKGGTRDKAADANGGRFDSVLSPEVDATTGAEDIPDEATFKEAIARAAAAAKAIGKMPGSMQRMVDELLEPQVQWREKIRMVVTGYIGARHETWSRPNRRRIVLNTRNPITGQGGMMYLPGRRGYGADTVVVVIDNSGSVGDDELAAFFAEGSGILADVRPRRVVLIWCDSKVRQVDEATSLDDLSDIRVKGSPGGGGTSFVPPFEWLKEEGIKPDTLVYLTDMYGDFPDEQPFPVIWCSITEGKEGPFGETVHIDLSKEVR